MNKERLEILIKDLISLERETEWVEFKRDNEDPERIGECISALSNAAALNAKKKAYMLWGIDDSSHAIIGTRFRPKQRKVGAEEFENWLLKLLEPRIEIKITEITIEGKFLALIEIQPATNRPVSFKGSEYIRVGSYTKKLRDYPEKERNLWKCFEKLHFEEGIITDNVSADEVIHLIDYPNVFKLLKQQLPSDKQSILSRLASEKIIIAINEVKYSITNLGALLFANSLKSFEPLDRKALRVITYKGANRIETTRETTGTRGYAVGFASAISYINNQQPHNEEIEKALRKEMSLFPELAIRELVANALIHQDFNCTGAGRMVEIFTDRVEISNPGTPLIEVLRLIDEPPRSRNEHLAKILRRTGICEERGSGIDKVIYSAEIFQLPAPDFRVTNGSTIAILYAPRKSVQMTREERIRACYQHACLLCVSGKQMTNATLRQRLGIVNSNYPIASRVIKDTLEIGWIKPYDEESTSRKTASYVPFWA